MKRSIVYGLAVFTITFGVAGHVLAQNPATTVTVNATGNVHSINPNIYGVANAGASDFTGLNFQLNRYGGNNSSRYNWQLNGDNRGGDWFFESIGDTSSTAGARGDNFITTTRTAVPGSQPLITIPMIPYVANLGSGRANLWSFSVAKYGAQQSTDPWNSDAGNGVLTSGQNVTGNNPLDANVANSASFETGWIQHIISTFGQSSNGGLKYYIMDNEPSLWNSTHRDVHPNPETYSEIYNDFISYAGAVRSQDANALIVGPEEWGWTGYFWSGLDQKNGQNASGSDYTTHANTYYLPWLLQQLKSYQTSTGKQLLNYLSIHFYPQDGSFSNTDSPAQNAIRNQSTRALWDPNYVDQSWINQVGLNGGKPEVIPLLKSWTAANWPGLPVAITEYNWGDEANLNGATTQADILGIFGRESLDLGCRWGVPLNPSPTYLSMQMYRNYDGSKSTFGDTSCSDTVTNPDNLSSFAATRASDGALTVMVINKQTGSTPVTVNLQNFSAGTSASVYQISSSTQTSINHLANVSVSNNAIAATVPSQSITLFVVPKNADTAQYNFETGTQSWTFTGAPVTSVASSTTQHFAGTHSLAVNISGAAGAPEVYVAAPSTAAGKTITFHVWIPTSSQLTSIQPFEMDHNWAWTGNWQAIGSLSKGAWNTLAVTVPSNAVLPLQQLGVQFTTGATWTGTCYIDSVSW
jgi:hypothetical protein